MNQSAFIKHRSLHDNFVLVRQVARKINMRRQTGVLLKLDLARAFDSISWSFLFEVLRRMGFGERFLKWIALLLYTANTRVMVNGVPGDRIYHGRGLRQGDPTSPMLFVAAMETLSAMIMKATEEGIFGNLASISPLQRISVYADDVVIFLKPEFAELWADKRHQGGRKEAEEDDDKEFRLPRSHRLMENLDTKGMEQASVDTQLSSSTSASS
ncbi:hypothetical protein ACQ4PT_026301 [Festuca glaucescens]